MITVRILDPTLNLRSGTVNFELVKTHKKNGKKLDVANRKSTCCFDLTNDLRFGRKPIEKNTENCQQIRHLVDISENHSFIQKNGLAAYAGEIYPACNFD